MSKLDDQIQRLREEERILTADMREHEQRFERARRTLELHQAKLQGMLEAKKLTEEAQPPKADSQLRRTRALSEHWKKILAAVDIVEVMNGGFGYDDLMDAAADVGHETGRDNLRSQMSLYKSAGFVASVGDGMFRLTEAGRKAVGIGNKKSGAETPNENEAPTGRTDGASETRSWSVGAPQPLSATTHWPRRP